MKCTFCGEKAGFLERACPECKQESADRWLLPDGMNRSYADQNFRAIERNFFELDKRMRRQNEMIDLLAARVYELEKEKRSHD